MSKLDELIQELCPNGIQYHLIGDICDVLTGGEAPPESIKEKEPQGEYIYPIYSNGLGDNALWGYSKTFRIDKPAVTFSSIGTIGFPTLREAKFTPIIRLKVIYPKDANKLNICFLKYALEIVQFEKQKSSVANVNASMIKNIKIPVPPLEVQQEIVRLLDEFTAKTEELQAELNKEYEARKTQYEYYKRRLFDGTQNHTITTLQDICENCDSMRKPVTSGNRESGNIPYYGASGIVDYVKDYIFDGDYLLVSEDGANLVARSTPIAFSISGKTWVNNHAHVLKFNEYATRKYVEMYLNSIDLKNYITGAAQPKLNQKNLNKITIPLPSLVEQKQIVSILESFEVSYKKIISELTFELESRQKQYEYYRDKLLTFKELK